MKSSREVDSLVRVDAEQIPLRLDKICWQSLRTEGVDVADDGGEAGGGDAGCGAIAASPATDAALPRSLGWLVVISTDSASGEIISLSLR
jgi:hypothetical protein